MEALKLILLLLPLLASGCVTTARYQRDLAAVQMETRLIWAREMAKKDKAHRAKIEEMEATVSQAVQIIAAKGKPCK